KFLGDHNRGGHGVGNLAPSNPCGVMKQYSKSARVRANHTSLSRYLEHVGGSNLLTREMEVEIAKRIETNERELRWWLAAIPPAMRQLAELGPPLKRGEFRLRDVVGEA